MRNDNFVQLRIGSTTDLKQCAAHPHAQGQLEFVHGRKVLDWHAPNKEEASQAKFVRLQTQSGRFTDLNGEDQKARVNILRDLVEFSACPSSLTRAVCDNLHCWFYITGLWFCPCSEALVGNEDTVCDLFGHWICLPFHAASAFSRAISGGLAPRHPQHKRADCERGDRHRHRSAGWRGALSCF
eukprot:SAG11_NODE_685_length_7739_cov_3.487435_4_plen_184_part_00